MKLRLTLLASALLCACSSDKGPTTQPLRGARDYAAHPIVEVLDMPGTLYAVSDAHGGYDRLAALLAANGVLARRPEAPASAEWSAGASVLVVAGDMIDKGPQAVEVLELLRALGDAAPKSGGRVVALLGNHEAEFLAQPLNDKAEKDGGFDPELRARGLDPVAVAEGREPLGAWLRERPIAAKVGRWFFAHGGSTQGRSVAELETRLRAALDAEGFSSSALVGDDSILEARAWYDDASLAKILPALDVNHVVFGHDPNALGARGSIAVAFGGRVLRIDCGLSPLVNDSTGKLLVVRHDAAGDHAEERDANGAVRTLF
jgi:hypothetical protein